jgi:hypothetical protein
MEIGTQVGTLGDERYITVKNVRLERWRTRKKSPK